MRAHTFIVVEENQDFSCMIGNPVTEFLNQRRAPTIQNMQISGRRRKSICPRSKRPYNTIAGLFVFSAVIPRPWPARMPLATF
jgi:hypothetical protein